MDGYSGTPLIKKLGIRSTDNILVKGYDDNYNELIGEKVSGRFVKQNEIPDFVHLFISSVAELDAAMPGIQKNMKPTTVIWVSWYKKTSGIKTDVTEDVIRSYALNNGLVDVKVCAVNDVWSALKLVVPLKLR